MTIFWRIPEGLEQVGTDITSKSLWSGLHINFTIVKPELDLF